MAARAQLSVASRATRSASARAFKYDDAVSDRSNVSECGADDEDVDGYDVWGGGGVGVDRLGKAVAVVTVAATATGAAEEPLATPPSSTGKSPATVTVIRGRMRTVHRDDDDDIAGGRGLTPAFEGLHNNRDSDRDYDEFSRIHFLVRTTLIANANAKANASGFSRTRISTPPLSHRWVSASASAFASASVPASAFAVGKASAATFPPSALDGARASLAEAQAVLVAAEGALGIGFSARLRNSLPSGAKAVIATGSHATAIALAARVSSLEDRLEAVSSSLNRGETRGGGGGGGGAFFRQLIINKSLAAAEQGPSRMLLCCTRHAHE